MMIYLIPVNAFIILFQNPEKSIQQKSPRELCCDRDLQTENEVLEKQREVFGLRD